MSPAFAGGFLTTGSSGKSLLFLFNSSEIYNFLSHMHQLVSGFSSFVCSALTRGPHPSAAPTGCRSLGTQERMDREAWRAAIHGVTKSWTQLGD